MEAPDKIYMDKHQSYVAYSIVPIPDLGGTEYVRKDALLEWAKGFTEPKIFVLTLLDKLNSM